jgi:hypothetical protein
LTKSDPKSAIRAAYVTGAAVMVDGGTSVVDPTAS